MQLTALAALWQAGISGTIWMSKYVVAGGTGIGILETRTFGGALAGSALGGLDLAIIELSESSTRLNEPASST